MMRRGFGIAVVTALLALSLPLSAVVAHDSGSNNGHRGKITVCHKANTAHPVTISISKAAWKAHKAHGDTEGPCPTPTKVPKPAPGQVCTFDAPTSTYGSATGPIHFSWTVSSGVVTVPGGYWNEFISPTTYYNNVTAGSVSGTGAVSLSFSRTNPNTYSFSFTNGQLTGNSLTGTMDGGAFSATGTVSCSGTASQDDDD
jgi:hypothetical protein